MACVIKTILRERKREREERDRELFTFIFLFLPTLFFGEAGTGSDQEQCDRARGMDGWRIGERRGRRGGGRDTRRRPPSPPFPFSPLVVAVWGLPWPGLRMVLLVGSASAVSALICVRLPTTTARQLERKHLTSSACLLFLPSLHICTCKGLLRLIWRLTGWLASMYTTITPIFGWLVSKLTKFDLEQI